jgi:hypothetical protein
MAELSVDFETAMDPTLIIYALVKDGLLEVE